jgi:hypothetical protein
MFSTNGQEVKQGGGSSKSFQSGVVYAHIYDGQLRTSNKGDKKVLELYLEGPAVDGFEGWPIDKDNPDGPKHKGQTARVSATLWTDEFNNTNVSRNEIMYKLTIIATELGMREELNAISASSIEDWVKQVLNLVKGQNLWFFLKGTEEEYNGKTITKLSLPKYKFCSVDEDKLEKFDKNNKYHFKSLVTKSVGQFEPATDDFEM